MPNRLLICLSLLLLSFNFALAIDENPDTQSIGQIAFIGADYNVYTYDVASESLNQLSTDASRRRHYQWTTWSNDGRLAYFCCDLRVTRELTSQVYISSDGLQAGELSYTGENSSVIYAAWSPANCSTGENCRDLALLMNNFVDTGLSVEMLQQNTEGTSTSTIERGAPFYYHWNSTGTQLLFHRNNTTLGIYDLALGDFSLRFSEPSSGTYQVPAWSPVDNQVIFGVTRDNATDLLLTDGTESRVLVTGLAGFVSFLWSPDGRYLAYRTIQQEEIGAIVVLEIATGRQVTSSLVDGIISFFWSPDSSKIAYVSFASRAGRNAQIGSFAKPQFAQASDFEFVWSVLNLATGENLRYSSFLPTYEMQYLLTYFDQFAPSHRLWSPDSRYLVYSSVVDLETTPRPIVNILDTSRIDLLPRTISEGVFSVWSFN